MFKKTSKPPRKLWTDEEKKDYQRQLREQRELREVYRRRMTKQGRG